MVVREAEVMPKGLWRQRDFLLVLSGGLVNEIGDWLLVVALPAYVYTATGSGIATSAIVVIELGVGICFGPYGGSLADRWDLRRTVVATNVLQALSLTPLLTVDPDRVWPAFLVAVIQGLLRQVNNPASFALVPRIVASDQLVQANSAYSAASSIARLVGSPLGGIAVAVGGLAAVVVADAVTFLAVAGATLFVRTPTASLVTDAEPTEGGATVREGWRDIGRHPGLRGYLGVEALAHLTYAMFPVLFIVFVVDVLDGNEATVGIIRGMAAFGGFVAAALVGRLAKRVDSIRLMTWGYAGLGLVAFAFIDVTYLTTALWLALLLFGLSGLPNMTAQIGAATTAQRLSPPAVLGRLRGLHTAGTAAGSLVGSIGVGLLVDHLDVRLLFNSQALLYVTCGALAYLAVLRPVAAAKDRDSRADDEGRPDTMAAAT